MYRLNFTVEPSLCCTLKRRDFPYVDERAGDTQRAVACSENVD